MNNNNIIIKLEENIDSLCLLFNINKIGEDNYIYCRIFDLIILKNLQLINVKNFDDIKNKDTEYVYVSLTDLGKLIKEQYQLNYFGKKLDLIEEIQDYVKQKYNCRIESNIIGYSNVFSDNCVDVTLTLYTNDDNNIPIYTQHLSF